MHGLLGILVVWLASIGLYFTILGLFEVPIATLALLVFIALGIAAWVKDERRTDA